MRMSDTPSSETITIEVPAWLAGPVQHFADRLSRAADRTQAEPWAREFLARVRDHDATAQMILELANTLVSAEPDLDLWTYILGGQKLTAPKPTMRNPYKLEDADLKPSRATQGAGGYAKRAMERNRAAIDKQRSKIATLTHELEAEREVMRQYEDAERIAVVWAVAYQLAAYFRPLWAAGPAWPVLLALKDRADVRRELVRHADDEAFVRMLGTTLAKAVLEYAWANGTPAKQVELSDGVGPLAPLVRARINELRTAADRRLLRFAELERDEDGVEVAWPGWMPPVGCEPWYANPDHADYGELAPFARPRSEPEEREFDVNGI